jgi:hypothetical protein
MTPNAQERIAAIRPTAAQSPHGTAPDTSPRGAAAFFVALPTRANNCDRDSAKRAGDHRGLVSAQEARDHILALGKKGVGYKSVAAVASVAVSIVQKIRTGERKQIRASTRKAILEVDRSAIADHALVPDGSTWRIIDELLDGGYTRTWIASPLGSKGKIPSLQLATDFITARSASRVERLYRMIQSGRISR